MQHVTIKTLVYLYHYFRDLSFVSCDLLEIYSYLQASGNSFKEPVKADRKYYSERPIFSFTPSTS
jgi:hypothetical protein